MPANSRNVAIARTLAKAWRPARDGRQQEQETPATHRKDYIRRKAFEIRDAAPAEECQECQQQQDKISSGTPSSGSPNTADASNSRNVSNSITASN
jgi:hypothetical protein